MNLVKYNKYDHSRSNHDTLAIPPHEGMAREIKSKPNIIQSTIQDQEWAADYWVHPVVAGLDESELEASPPQPYALYLDAAPYTKDESFLGFFVYHLLTGVRHLCIILRKSELCQCGCRGWCTLFGVFQFLNWCFLAMARKVFPSCRHDNTSWSPLDRYWENFAGKAMTFRAILLKIKGDWAEFAHSLGFPSWATNLFPCLFCKCTRDTMYNFLNISMAELPWDEHEPEEYEEACQTCEIEIIIPNKEAIVKIREHLEFDKRQDGFAGRALMKDVPHFGLLVGDRLEPSPQLPDIGLFDKISLFPTIVLFWRTTLESISKHRNPLFNAETGVNPFRTLAIDPLHDIHLGVLARFVVHCLWVFLLADIFDICLPSEEERLIMGVQAMRASLFDHYAEFREECKNVGQKCNVSELGTLTLGMLGKKNEKKMRAKAGQTKDLMRYVMKMLEKHQDKLRDFHGEELFIAGKALWDILQIMATNGRVLPHRALQELLR